MGHARIHAIVAAAVLMLVVTSCGGGSDNTSIPSVTLTVPGSPSAQVTDVVARGITKEQADRIRKNCQKAAAIPGTDEDCRNAIPARGPLCTPANHFCIFVGRIAGTQFAVMQVSSSQPGSSQPSGSPACKGRNVVLCKGIVVPVAVVAPLIGTSTASPTASVTTSVGTPTPTATPTTPTPTPSTPVAPTPTTSVSSQPPVS
jgi:hypothetical protein